MNGTNTLLLTELSVLLDKYKLSFIYVVEANIIRINIFMTE